MALFLTFLYKSVSFSMVLFSLGVGLLDFDGTLIFGFCFFAIFSCSSRNSQSFFKTLSWLVKVELSSSWSYNSYFWSFICILSLLISAWCCCFIFSRSMLNIFSWSIISYYSSFISSSNLSFSYTKTLLETKSFWSFMFLPTLCSNFSFSSYSSPIWSF